MLHPLVKVVNFGVIEGKGLIAQGLIGTGEVVSRLEPNQYMIPIAEVLTWSQEKQDDILHYGYQYNDTHMVCESGDERFMNHSCDPNTWWADSDTMIARRDIQLGEEITYDYATTEITVPFEMPCFCGSANCRHIVTYQDYLIPEWQALFGQHLPAHTLKAIAKNFAPAKKGWG